MGRGLNSYIVRYIHTHYSYMHSAYLPMLTCDRALHTGTAELVAVGVQHGYDVECEVGHDVLMTPRLHGELPDEVGDDGGRDPLPSVDT